MKIAVLMGGPSAEREVSLRSGAAVAEALEQSGAHVARVIVQGCDFELPRGTDVVFIALHGTFGEDGTLQQLLEDRGLPYTFSGPAASAKAFDKLAAKQAFVAAGVPTPRWVMIERSAVVQPRAGRARSPSGPSPLSAPSGTDGRLGEPALPAGEQLAVVATELGFPLVIKPARQGSSVGVEIVRAAGDLARACVAAGAFDDRLVAEEFIAGRELTVGILDDRALPVIEVKPKQKFFDYKAKYTAGETEYLVPAPLDDAVRERVQAVALQAHQCLGCRDLSRVDVMLAGDGATYVLEVNTVPGFTATSLVPKAARCEGLSFPRLCAHLVQNALARKPEMVAA